MQWSTRDTLTGIDEPLGNSLDAHERDEGRQAAAEWCHDNSKSLDKVGGGESQFVVDAVEDKSAEECSRKIPDCVYREREGHGGRVDVEEAFQMDDSVAE